MVKFDVIVEPDDSLKEYVSDISHRLKYTIHPLIGKVKIEKITVLHTNLRPVYYMPWQIPALFSILGTFYPGWIVGILIGITWVATLPNTVLFFYLMQRLGARKAGYKGKFRFLSRG